MFTKGTQFIFSLLHFHIRPQQRVMSGPPPTATVAPAVPAAIPATVPAAIPQVVTNIQKMPTVRVGTLSLTTHGQTADKVVPPPAILTQAAVRMVPPATQSQTRDGGGDDDMEVICLDSDSEDESSSGNAQQQGCHSNSTPTIAGGREGSFPPNVVIRQQQSSVGTSRANETSQSATSLLLDRPQVSASAIITSLLPVNPVLAATIANILASAKEGGIQVGNLMATAHSSTPRTISLPATTGGGGPLVSLGGEGGGGGGRGGGEEAAAPSQAGVFSTQAGTVASQVTSPERQPQTPQNPSSLLGPRLHVVSSSAHTTSPLATTTHSTSLTSAQRVSDPPTAIPLLSPIAARLFNHSMTSSATPSSSSLPVLTPLPPSSTARKTAIVPPYCAIVTSPSNLPVTSSQPQLHTSGTTCAGPPVSKSTAVDSNKAKPDMGSQESIILD